ncbi:MAG: hypothetical protein ACFFB5_24095 [Promethearchaeota archaeon]
MKRKFFVLILFFGFLLAILPVQTSPNDNDELGTTENEGIVTICVKHHEPSDLTIDIGQTYVDDDYRPSKGYDHKKAKMVRVWNRQKTVENIPMFTLTKTLNELGLTKNAPPEVKRSVWFVDIEDHGKFVYESDENGNRSEKAIEESINYLVGFNLTINGIIYTCCQHPLFDDGGVAHGEIYGLEEEIIIDSVRTSGDYDNALVVIGVSRFAFHEDVPNMAKDAWFFFDIMTDLAYDIEFFPYYTSFIAIDRSWEDHEATHSAIYTTTVNTQFNLADSHTGGNDQTIVFISSHGVDWTAGFHLYDSAWWWGRYYSDLRLAQKIHAQTNEGTDMWVWCCWCKSDSCSKINQLDYHHNHAVYWTYDHDTWADKRSVEIPEFDDMVRMYYSLLEIIFSFVDYKYHEIHEEDYYMTQRDHISGYFSLYN